MEKNECQLLLAQQINELPIGVRFDNELDGDDEPPPAAELTDAADSDASSAVVHLVCRLGFSNSVLDCKSMVIDDVDRALYKLKSGTDPCDDQPDTG